MYSVYHRNPNIVPKHNDSVDSQLYSVLIRKGFEGAYQLTCSMVPYNEVKNQSKRPTSFVKFSRNMVCRNAY